MSEHVTPTVFDLAALILTELGPMTARKLERLCYYAQAWSLAWDDAPLFSNRIESWRSSPICPDLYALHAGRFTVDSGVFPNGKPDVFFPDQRETIDAVLEAYEAWTSGQLSAKVHTESPWIEARQDCGTDDRSGDVITLESMAEYYRRLG